MREPYIGQPVTRVKIDRAVRTPVTPALLTHLEFLVSIGMNNYMIARAAGVSTTTVRNIRIGAASGSTVDVHRALMSVTPRPTKHQASVLSYGAVRRLEGLAVMGWNTATIGDQMRVDRTRARSIRSRKVITWSSHVAVDEAYRVLSHRDGGNARTKAWATRNGFVHPMWWDDIDDFFEVPCEPEDSGLPDPVVVERLIAGVPVSAAAVDKREAFEILVGRGWTMSAAAAHVGINHQTAVRYSNLAKGVAA